MTEDIDTSKMIREPGALTAEEIKGFMTERSTVYPRHLTSDALREAGCLQRVCVLPEDFNERVRYLGDTLVQMLCHKPDDVELRYAAGELCQALSYLLNSTSWRDGELHDFDLLELRRKMRRYLV